MENLQNVNGICAPATRSLRKLRSLSGYNMWHAEFLRSEDSKAFGSLAEKNVESARRWNEFSKQQKDDYRDEAASSSTRFKEGTRKQELNKVLKHLQGVSDHADIVPGLEVMYVAVSDGNHFVGGSKRGCQFLKDCGTYVPYSFVGYLSSGQGGSEPLSSATDSKGEDKDTLRVAVEHLFNKLYSQYVHKPKVKLPYSKIKAHGIVMEGLPGNITLKHPSSYGKMTLKRILQSQENLRLKVTKSVMEEMPGSCSTRVDLQQSARAVLHDHSYYSN